MTKLFFLAMLLPVSGMVEAQRSDTAHHNTGSSSLPDTVPDKHELIPVIVTTSHYRKDSLQNRIEYQKIFDYKKSHLSLGNNTWLQVIHVMGKKVVLDRKPGFSLLDITSLAHLIRYKKQKQILVLQKQLVQQEQDRYVQQVFTPALVERFSNLHDDDSLHLFVARYAPSFESVNTMKELDFAIYIKESLTLFRQGKVKKEE